MATSKPRKASAEYAIDLVEKYGRVAVFPEKKPRKQDAIVSLWELFYPRSVMRWEWDEDGDQRVMKLWWMKNEIAVTQRVLYGRFFGNRPVFVSKSAARKIIASLERKPLSRLAREIGDRLQDNSPQTKRMLGKGLREDGWELTKSEFERALIELQRGFHIVSLGDSDREAGPMPSSEYAALSLIFPGLSLKDLRQEKL